MANRALRSRNNQNIDLIPNSKNPCKLRTNRAEIQLLTLEPPNLSTRTSKFFASALRMHRISKFSTTPLPSPIEEFLDATTSELQSHRKYQKSSEISNEMSRNPTSNRLNASMFNFSSFVLHPSPIELFDPTISEHRYHPKYQTILHSGYFPLLPKLP